MHNQAALESQGWDELRRLRLKTGHSLTSLAAAVPMSLSHLCNVESGYRGLSDRMLIKLARALGVDADELDKSRPTVPPVSRDNWAGKQSAVA